MVYGVLKLINFAHGDVYMVGAFMGYYLANGIGSRGAQTLGMNPDGLVARGLLGGGAMDPVWTRLGELRLPVLLISGAADTRYMRIMDEMAASIPDHRREVVLRAGHAVHRERPQVVAQMVGAFVV